MSFARLQTRTRHSSAFTLVELMIVIAIVGVLASLITVGVMKAFERSKLVSARIEISQLEAAVAAAKLDLGNVDELPSVISLYYNNGNSLVGQLQYNANPANIGTGPGKVTAQENQDALFSLNTLTKMFGKTFLNTANMPWLANLNSGNTKVTLSGMDALVFWLGGIKNNGTYSGFSTNKQNPCDVAATKRKGPYYEFEASRFDQTTGAYTNAWGGKFVYISKSFYNYGPFDTVYAYRNNDISPKPANGYPANFFYNPKTFQIISSGQDQTFGPGGYYQPPFTIGVPGYDDLSNFSSTILGKKDE